MAKRDDKPRYEGEYVLADDGGKDFGELPELTALEKTWPAAKIRLCRGQQEEGMGDYGEAHIERPNRLKQIRSAGYRNAQALVADVAKNFDLIYQKKNGKSLILFKKTNNAAIYLQYIQDSSGGFYSVYTGVITRKGFDKYKKPLWTRSKNGFQKTDTVAADFPQQNMSPDALMGISDTQVSPQSPKMSSQHPLLSNTQAVAIDLDGTVLSSSEVLSERTVRALRACMGRGIQVIIATGRSIQAAESCRARIGAAGPMVYANGAQVADMPQGRILERRFLGLEAAVFCAELGRKSGAYYQVFFCEAAETVFHSLPAEFIVTETATEESARYRARTSMDLRVGRLDDAFSRVAEGGLRCIKGLFITAPETVEKLRPVIQAEAGDTVSLIRSWPTFLEVLPAGVSKGRGLLAALKYRGLPPEYVIAFGDEENDLSLFEVAGISAAPANARDTVRAAACFVIPSNDEDGVAQFLEERVLGTTR
jgi:Cof subfamily protein (haloacid dehalogenase superfamily)